MEETIKLQVDDSGVKRGVAGANEGLKSVEKSANQAQDALGRHASKTGELIVRTFDTSKRSIDRMVDSVEKKLAYAGQDKLGKLRVDREFALRRVAGDETAARRINAAYDQMIAKAREAETANNKVNSSFGGTVGSLAKMAASYIAIDRLVSGMAALVSRAIELNTTVQRAELSLGILFKNVAQGKETMRELFEIGRTSSVFDLDNLTNTAKLLAALKFDAKDIPQMIRAIGDAAAGLGPDRVERVAIALGQIRAKGRVQAEELRQLSESGINAIESLARASGLTSKKFLEEVEKGAIPAQEAIRVLLANIEKDFGGLDRRIAQETTGGMLRQTKFALQEAVLEFGRVIDPMASSIAKDLIPAARGLRDVLAGINEQMKLMPKPAEEADRSLSAFSMSLMGNMSVAWNPAISSLKLLKDLLADVGRANSAQANEARRTAIKQQLASGKSPSALADIGITVEEVNELFPKAAAEEMVKRYQLISGAQRDVARTEKEYQAARVRQSKLAEAEKSEKTAKENAERRLELMKQLRDESIAAKEGLAVGDTDAGRQLRDILSMRRRLQELGASPAELKRAEALQKERFAAEDLTKANAELLKMEEALRDATVKRAAASRELMDNILKVEIEQQSEQIAYMRDARERMESLRIESAQDTARRERDLQIAAIENVGAITVQQKIEVERQKLAVEQEFIRKSLSLQIQKINAERNAELIKIQDQLMGASDTEAERIRERIGAINERAEAQKAALRAAGIADQVNAEAQATAKITQLQISEQERVFDAWRDGFSRTIDAFTTNWKSFGDFAKGILMSMIVTPMKELASNWLSGMMTGNMGMAGARMRSRGGILAGLLGGGMMPAFGGGMPGMIGSPTAPGGTGTFTGAAIPGVGGMGGMMGGGMMGLKGLGMMPLSMLRGLGNIGRFSNVPFLGTIDKAYSGGSGVYGATGGAMLAGGGILAAMGLQRGGLSGLAMTTAGGALIGAKFGGPVGAAIGAGIGAVAGFIRLFFKGAVDKTIQKVKALYQVTLDKKYAQSIVEIAKQTYGGNLDVAIQSPQVREMIQLYAMATGQSAKGMPPKMQPYTYAQANGGLTMQPVFQNGSPLPSLSPVQSGGGTNLTVVLDPEATKDFWETQTLRNIDANPRAVQAASMTAQRGSFGRRETAALLLQPGLVTT